MKRALKALLRSLLISFKASSYPSNIIIQHPIREQRHPFTHLKLTKGTRDSFCKDIKVHILPLRQDQGITNNNDNIRTVAWENRFLSHSAMEEAM